MKIVKRIVKILLLVILGVFALALIVAIFQGDQQDVSSEADTDAEVIEITEEPIAESVSVPEVKNEPQEKVLEETMEEQMARWDKGDFTDEEIAEIKTEEKREDKAVEEYLNQ